MSVIRTGNRGCRDSGGNRKYGGHHRCSGRQPAGAMAPTTVIPIRLLLGARICQCGRAHKLLPESAETDVDNASRLRIDFRQLVGDVEWRACAESSSG